MLKCKGNKVFKRKQPKPVTPATDITDESLFAAVCERVEAAKQHWLKTHAPENLRLIISPFLDYNLRGQGIHERYGSFGNFFGIKTFNDSTLFSYFRIEEDWQRNVFANAPPKLQKYWPKDLPFGIAKDGSFVLMDWQTKAEINGRFFDIQETREIVCMLYHRGTSYYGRCASNNLRAYWEAFETAKTGLFLMRSDDEKMKALLERVDREIINGR